LQDTKSDIGLLSYHEKPQVIYHISLPGKQSYWSSWKYSLCNCTSCCARWLQVNWRHSESAKQLY